MLKILISMAAMLLSVLHPLHVSICEIEYDPSSKSLEIIQRIFLDDLESEIRLDLGLPELDITVPDNGSTLDDMAEAYLLKRLKFEVNGKEASYKYLGHEIEGDAILCYIEIEKVKKLKSIKVHSDILLDFFDDQINIIHVEVEDRIRSMKLTPRNRSEEFQYDK
ncbi:MAG: DUF6702 family protein [Bacteroidota bacterium]